jgi:hypothetical protein
MLKTNTRIQRVLKGHIYYIIWFDGNLINGRKASKDVQKKYDDDKIFSLNEFDKCMEYISQLKNDHCDYSFHLEDWNEETESVDHFTFRHFKH